MEILSILTAPEGAVQYSNGPTKSKTLYFQSSPPPKERCNVEDDERRYWPTQLSILTAPEGAVQFFGGLVGVFVPLDLSILTAPEGAVQCGSVFKVVMAVTSFQSSPPPKERCNTKSAFLQSVAVSSFQSSPPPKERCNAASLVKHARKSVFPFNPHRPRRSGAIPRRIRSPSHRTPFNPHRPRRSGAINRRPRHSRGSLTLSILTAPEGAVQ